MQASEIPSDIGAAARPRIFISAGSRRPLFDARELWKYREVLHALILREINIRYAQTLVGAGWVILQPVLTTAVLTVLAGRWMRVPTDGVAYPLFAYTGLVPWIYFTHVLTRSSMCLINTGILSKAYFPRLLLPMASAGGALMDVAAAGSVLAILMIYHRTALTLNIVLLPAAVVLLTLAAFAAGVWVAVLNLYYRDVAHALPFATQILFFVTPVAYPVSLVPMQWRWIYSLNPMTGVVEFWRWTLLGGRTDYSPVEFATSFACGVGMLLAGLWFFRHCEPTMSDVGEGW